MHLQSLCVKLENLTSGSQKCYLYFLDKFSKLLQSSPETFFQIRNEFLLNFLTRGLLLVILLFILWAVSRKFSVVFQNHVLFVTKLTLNHKFLLSRTHQRIRIRSFRNVRWINFKSKLFSRFSTFKNSIKTQFSNPLAGENSWLNLNGKRFTQNQNKASRVLANNIVAKNERIAMNSSVRSIPLSWKIYYAIINCSRNDMKMGNSDRCYEADEKQIENTFWDFNGSQFIWFMQMRQRVKQRALCLYALINETQTPVDFRPHRGKFPMKPSSISKAWHFQLLMVDGSKFVCSFASLFLGHCWVNKNLFTSKLFT